MCPLNQSPTHPVLVEQCDHHVDERVRDLDIGDFPRHLLQQFSVQRLTGQLVEVKRQVHLVNVVDERKVVVHLIEGDPLKIIFYKVNKSISKFMSEPVSIFLVLSHNLY